MTAAHEPVGRGELLDLGDLASGTLPSADARSREPAQAEPSVDPRLDPRPVLVAGVPRSGTTWVAKALAHTRGAVYLHEPDNPAHLAFAHAAKCGLGRYPRLLPGDRAPLLHELFSAAWSPAESSDPERRAASGRVYQTAGEAARERALDPADGSVLPLLAAAHRLSSPRQPPVGAEAIVVKSVHVALCLEWVCAQWDLRIVVVQRHPLEIVASWLDMGIAAFLHEDDRHIAAAAPDLVDSYGVALAPADDAVARVAWTVGLLVSTLDASARRLGLETVEHELLCRDPLGELRWLARGLGLAWTTESTDFVSESDRPGRGEHTFRVAAELPDRWRERLDAVSLETARRMLAQFPVADRYREVRAPDPECA